MYGPDTLPSPKVAFSATAGRRACGGNGGNGNGNNNPELCDEGYVSDGKGGCVKKPCAGDPVPDPEIAPQTNSGIQGGMDGCTRIGSGCPENSSKKDHDGIDIKNPYGAPIYAMYDGFIYNTLYQPEGAGYWTQIQSTVNGQVIITQYFHMLNDHRRVTSGSIKAGDIIGYQGDSGNLKGAIEKKYTVSHVHVGVRVHDGSNSWDYYENFKQTDPRPYLSTQISDDGVSETGVDCN